MKTHSGKAARTALLFALPLTILIVAYLLYSQPAPEAPPERFARYGDTGLRPEDSVKLAMIQASIDKELDSLERYPPQEWLTTYYNDLNSQPKQNTPAVGKRDDSAQNRRGSGVLKGPSALFSQRYSLRIGRPVLVHILWAPDSSFSPVKLELVTITLNDVADDKAGFTLADSSAVLLYSGTQYAANDKISIEDKDHNLHISVLQVQPDAVSIELTSYLTDEIVSRLKGWN